MKSVTKSRLFVVAITSGESGGGAGWLKCQDQMDENTSCPALLTLHDCHLVAFTARRRTVRYDKG